MSKKQLDEVWEMLLELARYAGVALEHGELGDVIRDVACAQDRNRHPYMEIRTHDGRRYHMVAALDGVCGVSDEYHERQRREQMRELGLEEQYDKWQPEWDQAIEEAGG